MRSGIIAIATLAVLAAVITTLALSSFTAEAQGDPGAVANLQLTSTSAGELTVSWDAASPTPTDYRVDWAKSTEGYQSWKVDEGHVYPTPDATTTTITDLSHDTEYKIRMRARYYRGEHEGKSWGGPWAEATITVTGEPAETPTPEPVQQPAKEDPIQEEPAEEDTTAEAGTIDTLAATDDAAGQLVLTWDPPAAPNAAPTDYHINWAKSTEEYPANTAEAGNAHPTTTTHTLVGLEYDTDYNVRVRARYTASPWNGPWTETTAQVKLPLPAAPFIGAIAVSPDREVLLTWFNSEENNSITGYQVLRGPDAENLVVIKDDTGSSSTSYTDTTPPTGQTHTYGVKARNASGLSPTGTATATVPAAEVEEELVTARHESTDNTLVSNLGQTSRQLGANLSGNYEFATPFQTGDNPFGYHATSVQVYLRLGPSQDAPTSAPELSIRSNARLIFPGETVLYTFTTSSVVTDTNYQLFTFTTANNTTLFPNTKYWLHATTTDSDHVTLQYTQNDEDAESDARWSIGEEVAYRQHGTTNWIRDTSTTIRMGLSGHAIKLPVLVSNLESSGENTLFIRNNANDDNSKIAQSFSAAENTDGTSADFDFRGITVLIQSGFTTPVELAANDILVTVHRDTGDQPGDLVYTLTPTETYVVLPDSTPVAFLAPAGSTLSSGITYWVKFEIAADSTFFTGIARIFFESALDNNEVQGPHTVNPWSIGDGSLKSPETLSWATDAQSIKMSVLGRQRFDTLVSNIDQTFWAPEPTGPDVKVAQSFRTPPGPLGQQYRLHRVDINAASQYPTQATVDLHADDDGAPGDHLAGMIMPGDFAPGELTPADLITVAPGHTNLNPGTRYWIVITNEQDDNLLYISVTESKAQDSTSLDGWQIDNQRARSRPDKSWAILRGPIQMELLGTPFIRTNEADGPDLPGAGHNAHKTGAVVIPGIVSTGHLTPGLDRNHGLYGDYWWLDTQWGHSYRIEVKFGDSPNTATGGSAWTYFIDGDRRGTCCDSDHNRNDGYTVLHIKHDQNRKYLIDVVVFDKLNSGSKNFNGPYTITMTDITGTDKLVSNLYIGTLTKVANYVGSNRQYASSFTAGHNPGGYKLDRIRTHIPDDHSSPVLALHTDTSFAPGTKLCDFRNPTQVQHLVYWEDFPAPIPFTAPDCADVILVASTRYWIVFAGTGYKPVVTDSGGELTREGGWSIGNTALTKTTGTWGDLTGGIIAAEIWASRR